MAISARVLPTPAAHEAEVCVLGAVLMDAETIPVVRAIIRPGAFASEAHQRIFRSVCAIHDAGGRVDPVTVAEDLKARGHLDAVGGMAYLAELLDAAPSAASVEHHARIVLDRWRRRRLMETARQIAEDATDVDLGAEAAEARAVERLRALREGARIDRFRLIDDAALEDLPAPEFLIDGLFPAGGLVIPYGPPGSWKSFVALAWALCVQTGFPWQGRAVRRGQVVYVAAEGSGGMGARVRAWKTRRHFIGRTGILFVTEPVILNDPDEVALFLDRLATLPERPALIVFDTFARCFTGDEVNGKDVGAAIAGMDRIRAETGAAVIVIHHTNASGERERGHTALRGAADTMIAFEPDDDLVILSCTKQKDAAPFEKIRLQLVPVGESAAVEPATGGCQVDPDHLTESDREALATLTAIDTGDGVTLTAWMKSAKCSERSLYRSRKRLLDKGFIAMEGEGRGARHRVTEEGRAALPDNLPAPRQHPASQGPCTLPATRGPFRGPVAWQAGWSERLADAFEEDGEDA